MYERLTIAFGVSSDWITKWRDAFKFKTSRLVLVRHSSKNAPSDKMRVIKTKDATKKQTCPTQSLATSCERDIIQSNITLVLTTSNAFNDHL